MNANDADPDIDKLADCSAAVRSWYLPLNSDKLVIISSALQLQSTVAIYNVNVAGNKLQVATSVTIDSHLWRGVTLSCQDGAHDVTCMRSLLTDDLAQTLACSIAASRFDYCNNILYSSPAATLDVLQRAQNNLSRVAEVQHPRRHFSDPSSQAPRHLQGTVADMQDDVVDAGIPQ